jgi:hypothetical protein
MQLITDQAKKNRVLYDVFLKHEYTLSFEEFVNQNNWRVYEFDDESEIKDNDNSYIVDQYQAYFN